MAECLVGLFFEINVLVDLGQKARVGSEHGVEFWHLDKVDVFVLSGYGSAVVSQAKVGPTRAAEVRARREEVAARGTRQPRVPSSTELG